MPLSLKTPVFLTSRGQSAKLSVLVNRVAYPIDSWVIADGIMGGINQDYLEVFVGRILIKPV
jgi:hypothetical protein